MTVIAVTVISFTPVTIYLSDGFFLKKKICVEILKHERENPILKNR
jgi:hypothetical protein